MPVARSALPAAGSTRSHALQRIHACRAPLQRVGAGDGRTCTPARPAGLSRHREIEEVWEGAVVATARALRGAGSAPAACGLHAGTGLAACGRRAGAAPGGVCCSSTVQLNRLKCTNYHLNT